MEEFFYSGNIKSLAVMGGSFDPIHYGHLRAAESVREEFNIDMVVFIPLGKPPHKDGFGINHKEHRYIMTASAIMSNPKFHVSRIELDRDGYSYTAETLMQIKKGCQGQVSLYFIVGADSLVEMENWKNPEIIFSLCTVIAVGRPGTDKEYFLNTMKVLSEKYGAKILFSSKEPSDISSTEIRQKLKSRRSVKYLVPDCTLHYIEKNKLYGIDSPFADVGSMESYVKKHLSKKRYAHTMGVANTSVKLAKIYGADKDKAYIAGILHDMSKEFSNDKKLELCTKYGIVTDDIMKIQPDLTHSFVSAAMASDIFGVMDYDLLNAIKYHTTGRPNMSVLEKILLLADIIEPERGNTEELQALRKLSEKNLDKALCQAIKTKLDFTRSRGKALHPMSLEALKYLECE